MTKDSRDILPLLKEELRFIEGGGYNRSVQTPWLPTSVFQDSTTCLNYGYPYRAHPCTECYFLDFVTCEHQTDAVPCHYIELDRAGTTIEQLELEGDEKRAVALVSDWLRARIRELEAHGH
jgi:hypothetical protein